MKRGKRLISFLVALFMALSLIPATVSTVFASQTDTPSDFKGTVYISYSFDGEYATGKDGSYMAYVPVDLEELAAYDFSALSDYAYDVDNDGKEELTVLKLFYYMLGKYGQGTSDFYVSGSPGSAYVAEGAWNYADGTAWTENLNYYYNSMYPLGGEGWGATCDQITLHDGDFIDVAHFSSWDFYNDENAGFQYFAGDAFLTDWAADAIKPATMDDGAPDYAVHSFEAKVGTPLKVSVMKTVSDFNTGGTDYTLFALPKVYYGASLYADGASSVSVSSETGYAEITFTEPGTYYLWTYGTGEGSIVNSPAYATVVVTADEAPTGLADGTYNATGLTTAVVNMYKFHDAQVVIKGDEAWLLTTEDDGVVNRYDGMAYGPQSEILDSSDATNHSLVEGTVTARVVPIYKEDGTTLETRTFVLPVPKSVFENGGNIYYMIKYRDGYSTSHDGDWYKAGGGDYYLTGYTLEKVSDSTDLPGDPEPGNKEVIAIIHTNDVHGHIEVEPYVKGLADEMKASGDYSLVLTVSGGDVYAGGNAVADYYKGELIPQIQDQIYDVIVPGNNDFPTGVAGNALLTALYEHTKTICTNIQVNANTDVAAYASTYEPKIGAKDFAEIYTGVSLNDGSLDYSALELGVIAANTSPWDPTAMFTTAKGTKVGLFGLTCTGGQAATFSHTQGTVAAAQECVNSLKADGADVIVGIGHVGWMGEGSTESSNGNDTNSWVVANEVQDMDALIDAHTHSVIGDGAGCYVGDNNVLVNQAASYGNCIGVMYITLEDGVVVNKTAELLRGEDLNDITPDAGIQALVDADLERLSAIAGDPVATTPYFLNCERLSANDPGGSMRGNETNLGDFVTDLILLAYREKLKEEFDFTFIPGFWIRSSVNEGANITMIELTSVIGYDNTRLRRQTYSAEEILQLVTAGLASVAPQKEGISFNQYAGLAITYVNNNGVGTPITIKVGDTLIYDAYNGGIQVDDDWTAKGIRTLHMDGASVPEDDPDIICASGQELRKTFYDYLADHELGSDYTIYPDIVAPNNRIVEVQPMSAIEPAITNKTGMFKVVTATAVGNADGSATLTFALSGTGYQNLYKGTYEQAVANGTATENWIKGVTNADGKLEFQIQVAADELGKDVPVVAVSQSYYDKYLNGQNSLERAFYPRQLNLNLREATLVTGDYEVTKEIAVTNNISMFRPGTKATLHVVGGPNSNNYAAELILPMTTASLSEAFVGYPDEAEAATETIAFDSDAMTFTIPVKWVETFGDPTTTVNLCNGKPFTISTKSANNGNWYGRTATLDEEAGTLVFDPFVDPRPANTVDEKIAKIQSQVFTDTTWADCEDAKAAWDALSDAEKALVEEYDYFGLDTGDATLDDPRNQDEIGENEILVVSFGTSFNDSRVATIKAIEDAIAEAYPDWSVRRAFTAQIIINHIYARDLEKIDNMDQALARAEANGVKNLIVQPTHLMHGAEYDELVAALEPYRQKMTITIAEPLLGEVGETGTSLNDDKLAVAEAVVTAANVPSDTALVLMGHGTAHVANITYTQMQAAMAQLGYNNVFVGTVEGEPEGTDAESILAAVKAAGYSKVVLRPLMVVAGDHANNDMADPEDEESWYSVFVADDAFSEDTVTCQIAGLGEIPAVQKIYVAHVKDALPTTVEVDFTSQMSGGFLHAPQFDYEVASNLAESYGYTDSVKGVSVLDVLVAAHELVFDDFTKETAESYLEMGRTGAPTTMFGVEGDPSAMYEPSYMGMFFYNHGWPNDGTKNERGEYTGTLFTTQEVNDGDLVEFFFNESGFYADTYTWFTDAEGNYSRTFTVQDGEDLDLVLNGAWIPDPAQLTKDEMDLVNFERAMDDLDEVQVYIVDLATGETTEIEGAVTDAGDVTLNFAEPGTYTITAYTDEDYMNSYVMTLTTIKVVRPAVPADITVTISDKGSVKMAQETVTVTDRNKDGKLDVDEALYAAHEKAYEGGAAAGYATGDSSWGLSVKKLWGDTSGAFGYYLNNVSCWSPTDVVSEGDYLSAFVYTDQSTWSDAYAYFGSDSYTEDAQASLTVELKKLGWNADYSQQTEQPAPGATLTLYDSTLTKIGEDKYSVEDNDDGSYTVTIKIGGTYFLVATDDDPILVPAVAKVVKAADPTEIAVTISDKGDVKMAQETVTVTDRNKDGKLDVDEALYAAHEKAYDGGAAAGYASGDSSWGLSVKKLWGDTSGAFGYYLNNVSCWSPTDIVSEGDYLSAFVYTDGTYWSDSYAYFGSDSYTEDPQAPLTVELKKLAWNDDYSLQTEQPAPGAALALYDSTLAKIEEDKYSVEETGDGSYTVTIKDSGSYILIATDDDPILVPAVAKVEVAATFPDVPADYTGVAKSAAGNWYYLKDGELQANYTGIQNNAYGWWRIENGKVNFEFNGLAANENGTWYLKDGKVDFNYTGFTAGTIKEGSGWWYVEKGQVKFDKTDILSGTANTTADQAGESGWWYVINSKVFGGDTVAKNANGWWVIHGGKVDFDYTGFEANTYGWWYAEKGQVKFDQNDIIHGEANTDPDAAGEDGWWLVEKSQVVNKTTVAQNKYGWWKVTEGKVDFTFTGIANNEYGWWYLDEGKVDFNYTGFASNENGWWYVEKGQITFKKNEVIHGVANTDGAAEGRDSWWYVKESKVTKTDTVASNANGWWRIVDGEVDFSCNSVEQNEYGWWYIRDGKVDFNYTGLGTNAYGTWYIKSGKVDFSFNGTYAGRKIVNGKAQ